MYWPDFTICVLGKFPKQTEKFPLSIDYTKCHSKDQYVCNNFYSLQNYATPGSIKVCMKEAYNVVKYAPHSQNQTSRNRAKLRYGFSVPAGFDAFYLRFFGSFLGFIFKILADSRSLLTQLIAQKSIYVWEWHDP